MSWLAENWIWVLFGVGFVAMHLFGHGCHGGHGGHDTGGGGNADPKKATAKPVKRPGAATPGSPAKPHRH